MENKIIYFTVTNDTRADQRMHRICNSLSSAGYDVNLVGRDKGIKVDQTFPYKIVLINTIFNHGMLFYFEYNIRLIIYLINKRLDIIASIDLDTMIAGNILSIFKRKKLVFDAHEYYINVPELSGRPIKKYIWILIEKIFVRNVSLAYTVNETLAHIFTERYKLPFHIIRNFPFKTKKSPQLKTLPGEEIILIYQGALNVGRGLDIYIDSMPQLPNCRLWICGTGDLENELINLINNSPACNRIEVKGFLTPDLLKGMTPMAHIGLNMLDPTSLNYYHSLANRYFDYVSAGIPAVHMDFPEYRKYNKIFETNILVKNYNSEEMIYAIKKIITNPDLYKKLSENCIKAQSVFNWQEESKKLLKLYNSIQ